MGSLLMSPLNMVPAARKIACPDVAPPQAQGLAKEQCQSPLQASIVSEGRTQAADTSHRGRSAEQSAAPTSQETRSRGCLRAPKLLLHCAPSLSCRPALQNRKKLSTLKSRFRPNRSTPASTSNSRGQAVAAYAVQPARSSSALGFGGAA
jgi:hypothetical protein